MREPRRAGSKLALRAADKKVGLAPNARLLALLEKLMEQAAVAFAETKEKQRHLVRLEYAAKSWDRPRTVIAKAEHTEKGANPRFILTSLEGAEQRIYDEIYCAGGEMENRIKEQQLGLFADRTSCQGWWANQFRLLFSSAYPHQQLFATVLGRLSSA